MKQKIIFDLHLDLEVYLTYPKFLDMKFKNLTLLDLKRHGDIPQFKKAGLKLAVVNIFPFEFSNNQWLPINFNKFFIRLNNLLKWLGKYDIFKIIYNKNDLKTLLTTRKIGVILGTEGLNFLDKPENVYKLYEKGIRIFGLNWNIDSEYSSSLKTHTKRGLTTKGLKLIKILENLPIVIDLAHSSFYTCKDVFKFYNKPPIFSHNGVKNIVDFEQNLDDEILDILLKKEGLIGLTLLPYSVKIKDKLNFNNWYKQFKYTSHKYKKILAIGTDFFGFKFNDNYIGARNYLDFHKSIIKNKLPSYLLFDNAFRLFSKMI